jgi:hypothetical protein
VADVQGERRADRRRCVEGGGDEAEAAQVRERGGDGHLHEDRPILKRLCELGEAAVGRLAEELLSNPRIAAAFSQALTAAFEAKGRVDRNIQTVLGLLNLPSRADLSRLLTKLEAIQGSLVNLNIKVDRLLAQRPPRRRSVRRPPAPPRDEADE